MTLIVANRDIHFQTENNDKPKFVDFVGYLEIVSHLNRLKPIFLLHKL